MPKYKIKVNGGIHEVEADANKPLLWILRDDLGLTGTKYGCGVSQCGACTVHIGNTPVRSCGIAISSLGNGEVTTIEGISATMEHPALRAWKEINVPQCGYCQTGQIMSAIALLNNNADPSDQDIDKAMEGNICRCGTYYRIRKAIHKAADYGKE
jgi:isoquinoline 1-oxidoreductase alpha subunit